MPPGATDIREVFEDEEMLSFIRLFANNQRISGAISIAPILLLKCGIMGELPFMAGIEREEWFEEGFTEKELSQMQGWTDNINKPIKDGYIISGNIITSVSYEFVRFGLAFAGLLGIDILTEPFGVRMV